MKRTVSFSKDSANLFFHILTACNLSCSHCYINPEQHGKNMLPLATIRKWLTIFAERRDPETINLILLGGEPTMHPDLPGIIEAARELKFGSVTVDTNGFLFHDILEKVTPEAVDYFSFSLDGATEATNDRLRGPGCYRHCTGGIRKAVEKGFKTSLIYTVRPENIEELPEMPELLKDLGVERFFIQVIGIRGKSAAGREGGRGKGEGGQISKAQWEKRVPAVAQRAAELGITATYPKVFLAEGEPFECAGLVADNYFIFPNGRVYRCPLCEDYPIHAMAIGEEGLTERPKINETDMFSLMIPEGCIMNRLIQPHNLAYDEKRDPLYRVACCMLKEEVKPG